MSKQWGAQCGPNNECWSGNYTQWCEAFPGGCNGGDIGDLGIMDIPREDLQKTLDASTTKFVLDSNDKILEVGMLAESGAQVGDVLQGFFTSHKSYSMGKEDDRKFILTWQFKEKRLNVALQRKGVDLQGNMKNPAT